MKALESVQEISNWLLIGVDSDKTCEKCSSPDASSVLYKSLLHQGKLWKINYCPTCGLS